MGLLDLAMQEHALVETGLPTTRRTPDLRAAPQAVHNVTPHENKTSWNIIDGFPSLESGFAKGRSPRRASDEADRTRPPNGTTVQEHPFTLHLLSLCLGAAVLALHTPAQAQVYECREGSRTVFSGIPCEADSAPLEVKPAAGDYSQPDDLRARLRTEAGRVELKRIDDERAARRRDATAENELRRKAESDHCLQIRKDRARALRHPDNARREREAAEKLSEREFFECRRAERLR
ncbi:hypothetical protein ebA3790 [Aromatoleum aromaticum EbN1]|uniref:DUF4124 domain-containing protein n=1 Tax=Aromatoleum aromaticum (strain DSM 19018 / LMG 30748 / EbN1) TaxID=76114 RepID=Q5P354_AROAE|nr:hypothetical protein [Aromatoleum aromaticum]CAI08260.1 hypothetical protein ebA3790 [Aromatoleum aromaticum EbN1]